MPDMPKLVPTKAQYKKRPTKKTTDRGYGADWQQIRAVVLKAQPLCKFALEGCTGWATAVHHSDHNTANNDRANLFGVCAHCHAKYHGSHA